MRVDRILVDLLDWIGRVLLWKEDKKSAKPYEILQQYRGKQGILKLVERDTPRAVRTYIFSPFPADGTNRMVPKKDIHLCLDHLWQTDNPVSKRKAEQKRQAEPRSPKQRRRVALTHRISVFEASRFLNKDGTYNTEQLYVGDFDLLGDGFHRDQYAVPIFNDLAMVLKEFPVDTINWQLELETGCKRHLGSQWRPQAAIAESEQSAVSQT